MPQLQAPAPGPWRPPRALAIGGVITALLALLVATLAFFGGATPFFHLAQSISPTATATVRTLILATATQPPATVASTTAPTASADPKHTATPTQTSLTTPTATPTPPGTGLTGRYYRGVDLQDPVALARVDSTVNFDWSSTPPDPSLPNAKYSVRWTGRLRATVTDTYTITFVSDDGVRLYFNGDTNSPAINDWNSHPPTTDSFQVALNAGQFYSIVIEYYQRNGGAVAQLYWAIGGGDRVIVPSSQLYAQ